MLHKPVESLKIITCHLGNGASITAVKNGKSIETSMGLPPRRLAMGTRCGSIDPAISTFIMEKENIPCQAVNDILNKNQEY